MPLDRPRESHSCAVMQPCPFSSALDELSRQALIQGILAWR